VRLITNRDAGRGTGTGTARGAVSATLLRVALAGLVALAPAACKKKGGGDDGDDGDDGDGAVDVSSGNQPDDTDGKDDDGDGGYDVPETPTVDVEDFVPGEGAALTRVVPEQLSNNLVAAVNFGDDPDEFRYDDMYAGQRIDYLLVQFGVPLGGVDFVTATRRDVSTKAQTLLVARVVASRLAVAAVWKEWEREPGERVVFTKCDMQTDRPWRASDAEGTTAEKTAARAADGRWAAQVEELYFRFYARPPTSAELDAVRAAFLAVYAEEGYPGGAWVAVIYALLASEEFWHV
jgi:hypothetical protein